MCVWLLLLSLIDTYLYIIIYRIAILILVYKTNIQIIILYFYISLFFSLVESITRGETAVDIASQKVY